ncbi:hypothetical protein J3459_010283 [Metarhizium acridum]|nr:hypothetical protein J3459_010283 [Metarhizium acridum]
MVIAATQTEETMTEAEYQRWAIANGNKACPYPTEHKTAKIHVRDHWKYDIFGLLSQANPALQHVMFRHPICSPVNPNDIYDILISMENSVSQIELKMKKLLDSTCFKWTVEEIEAFQSTYRELEGYYADIFDLVRHPLMPRQAENFLLTKGLPERYYAYGIYKSLVYLLKRLPESREHLDGFLVNAVYFANNRTESCPCFENTWRNAWKQLLSSVVLLMQVCGGQ